MTTQTPAKISCLKLDGYKIELSTNGKGNPVAKYYKLLTAGKNKDTYKLIEGYYFKTEERRVEWITKVIANIKLRTNEKKQRKEVKQSVRENFVNPYVVGDIYYDSWGYDQTNVDFYQIIEVKNKSVVLQEIGCKTVKGSEGMMCCNVEPDPTNKIKEPFLKPVLTRVSYDNSVHHYIHSRHGSISKYEKADKGVYCSWYA